MAGSGHDLAGCGREGVPAIGSGQRRRPALSAMQVPVPKGVLGRHCIPASPCDNTGSAWVRAARTSCGFSGDRAPPG